MAGFAPLLLGMLEISDEMGSDELNGSTQLEHQLDIE
jgi:hypothetical protein